MDNELFDLCKEVYKRFPKWIDVEESWHEVEYTDHVDLEVGRNDLPNTDLNFVTETPLYTSDYLLNKISTLAVHLEHMFPHDESQAYWGSSIFSLDVYTYGETPLKALLKLVLALDDAGIKL
jgi:hypothetical protein